MKNSYFIVFLTCLAVLSCEKTTEVQTHLPDSNGTAIFTKSSSVDLTGGIYKRLSRHLPESLIDREIISIQVVEEDSPLMYVLNFEDGWAIMSSDMDKPSVIAYNEVGHFDPDNIDNPELEFWFEMRKNDLKFTGERLEQASFRRPGESPRLNMRYWWVFEVTSETVQTTIIDHVDHLMSTTWGQGYPWNYKCPYGYNVNYGYWSICPTGCVAVAMAQIMYYLHGYIGKPTGLYEDVGYYNRYDTTSFYRSSYVDPSSRWSSMALNKNQSGTDYVGDFMLDIGNRVGMHYFFDGSGATTSASHYSYYGIDCNEASFSDTLVVNSLDNGLPVMIDADHHAWVIDGYYKTIKTTYRSGTWHRIYAEVPDPEIEYAYTIPEYAVYNIYPNIYDGQVMTETFSRPENYYLMNWGWDDTPAQVNYNNGHYSMGSDSWNVGNLNFTSSGYIFYGFN